MSNMKDSGYVDIGQIPNSWNNKRLKYLCSITTGDEDTQNANPDGEYPFYVRSPIVERCNRYTFDGEGILIAGDGAGAGRVFHHVYGKYAVHQRVYRLYDFECDSTFLHYYLSNLFPKEMDKGSAQSTVPSMRLPMLLDFGICLPSAEEQKLITEFLDDKVSKINDILSDLRKQVETLQKYKKSVITKAVTKGLNPNVEMKDSGIDWIGEIPEQWKLTKTKYKAKIENGTDPQTEGEIPVYGSGASSFKTCGEYKMGPTVLLGRKGATLHIPHYIEGKYWNVDTAFNVNMKDDMNLRFFYYLSICFDYKFYISQTTLPGMTQTDYGNMYIPYPNINEQQEIVGYLDDKCTKIDELIKDKEAQIDKMEKYKKSLIYEYVTGKKRVKGAE